MDDTDYELNHWQQINDLFVAARARPPEERVAFLYQACADHSELRAEVESLLAAYDASSDDFLHEIDLDQAAALIESAGEPGPGGQQIGPYRVVREIGRGGMGTVYLADRADGQFQQQVALKLIKRGMDSEVILQRFLHERQILARLQHVNVARLLDGGVSADGQPYFAMEYVEGVPLTKYCDAKQLNVEARLGLFEQVCRAVHYAHTNLVVHRDLKPSNMLVTEDGELKLLDFGIAKLLDDDTEAGMMTLTEAGVRAMTPEYAAPEQVRGAAVTTATDIYALGVVLYELLTGHRPYQFERRTPEAVAQVVNEAEPARPSTAVSQSTSVRRGDGTTETITPEGVSRARSTQPDRLQRRLRGDLDVVVLKALRKEPARRYASAEAFVEDIRRHLAGLPVVARQDTVGYRARKFVGRHWVGVLAASLVVASLVVGLTVAVWQARVARQEATKAEEVKEFMLNLFEMSDPNQAKGETITARELLDAGAGRVEVELSGQPEVQAEMMTVVGEVYQKLGLYEPAQPLLEQALALRQAVLGEEHEDVATSLHNLAALLYDRGDYDSAEPLVREALAMRRKLLGTDHEDVAASLHNLAAVLREKGDYDAAEPLVREALAMRRTVLGDEHPDVARSLNGLALVVDEKGDYDAAEPLYREALAMRRRVLDPKHSDVTISMNNLARLLKRKGDYDEAEPLYREALAMKRKLLGEEHPDVAIGLNNLAYLLRNRGDYDAAEPLQREALALWQKRLGEEHPTVAIGLNNLALLLRQKGDYDAAVLLYREALAMRRKLLGSEHRYVSDNLHNLALTMQQKGDHDAAEPLFREALAMRRKLLGNEHPSAASTLVHLGHLLIAQDRPSEAEPLVKEALAIRQARYGSADARTAEAQNTFGALLSALGRHDEAEPLLLAGYEGLTETRGEQARTTQRARDYLVAHYKRQGKLDQAAAYRRGMAGN